MNQGVNLAGNTAPSLEHWEFCISVQNDHPSLTKYGPRTPSVCIIQNLLEVKSSILVNQTP